MSIETSPKWVQEQVRNGLNIDKKIDIKTSIDTLSKETLITFFGNYDNTPFLKNAGPKNSAAHIIAYQKALNMLGASLDTDGVWGEKTRSELEKFQKQQGLKGKNGIPGTETIGALKDALQKSLPKEEIIEETRVQKVTKLLSDNGYVIQYDGSYRNTISNTILQIDGNKIIAKSNPRLSNEDQEKKLALMGQVEKLLNASSTK